MTAIRISSLLIMASVACSDSPSVGPAVVDAADGVDAKLVDARNPDAAVADANLTTPIRVMVYDDLHPGQPAVGVPVTFDGPEVPAFEVLTNAEGIAEAQSPAGTTVTAAQSTFLSPAGTPLISFATFVDLGPGDYAVAGPRHPVLVPAISFTVIVPQHPDGEFYTLSASCPTRGGTTVIVCQLPILSPAPRAMRQLS